jgi:hypothetical protein
MNADGIKLLNISATLQGIADDLDTQVKHAMFWADEVTTDYAGLLDGLRMDVSAISSRLLAALDQI